MRGGADHPQRQDRDFQVWYTEKLLEGIVGESE
jgi:hypothetical protein